MEKFLKYTKLNKNIEEAMLQCENVETANKLIDFLKLKNEKYTYFKNKEHYFINSFFPSFPSLAWGRLVTDISKIADYKERIPIVADIVVTGRCHCKCWHCFRAKHGELDLSLSKIKECIQVLHDMGAVTVGITGGEPMLRSDITDIFELIPDDMEGQLYTTGKGINDEFAEKLSRTRITRCIISLDHYDREVVCRLRNNKNAYDDAIGAISALSKVDIYTTVTVCLTEELASEEKLERYVQFANKLGVSEIRIVMQIPQGNLQGAEVGRIYGKSLGLVKRITENYNLQENFATILNFSEIESSNYFGCNAGSNYISINNDGNVSPCVAVPLAFGNVHTTKLEEIYENMKKFFPCSSRVCYGIAAGRIIKGDHIDTSKVPISLEQSEIVANKCIMATGYGELFKHCKTRFYND